MRGVPRVTLYGKPGCHLCDDARTVVERVRAEHPFELREVDVSLDPELHRAYGERIPVLELDGEELFEFFVDEPELVRRVARVDGPGDTTTCHRAASGCTRFGQTPSRAAQSVCRWGSRRGCRGTCRS